MSSHSEISDDDTESVACSKQVSKPALSRPSKRKRLVDVMDIITQSQYNELAAEGDQSQSMNDEWIDSDISDHEDSAVASVSLTFKSLIVLTLSIESLFLCKKYFSNIPPCLIRRHLYVCL